MATVNITVLDAEELKKHEGDFLVPTNLPGIGPRKVLVEADEADGVSLGDFIRALTGAGEIEAGEVATMVNGRVEPDLETRIRPGDSVAATRRRNNG